jgi:hypothetical protein
VTRPRTNLAARLALALALATPADASSAPARPAPVEASPAEGPRVAFRVIVLPRQEGDALPASIDTSLRESLRDGLRAGGAAPVQPATIDLASCTDAACLGRLRAAFGVRYAVRARFAAVDRDYTLRLELLDTSAAVVAEFDDRCALCGLTEARARVAEGATRLVAEQVALADAPSPPTLSITVDPPGAAITLDGAPIGRAPLTPTVTAGAHTLRIDAPGHLSTTRTVQLRPGEALDLQLRLLKIPPPPRLRGRALLGVGVPLVAAGVVLLALDDRQFPRGCALADCRRFEATWPAAGLLLAGTALTAIGAVLLHQSRARRRAARSR